MTDIDEDGFVLTIGNFDGVHLGHQAILSKIKSHCLSSSKKLAVMTFRPHPVEILRPQQNFLINDYDEKRDLLESVGVDYLVEIEFNRDFSTTSAEDFLLNFVFCGNKVSEFFLGYDFAFGANKEGSFELANKVGKEKNVKVEMLKEESVSGISVSSTEIRNKIQSGDVELAGQLLGRFFFLTGQVSKGEGRGKQLGFPTANLNYKPRRIIPKTGVYLTRAIVHGKPMQSITNVGFVPTFGDRDFITVETHLIDYSGDLYGLTMKLEFLSRIRDEKKFNGPDELKLQIALDIESAVKNYEKYC